MLRVRKLQQPRGWAFAVGATIVKPVLFAIASREWIHGDKIPVTGGCVLAFNHISHLDPLTAAHLVYDHGRLPRGLAKAELFKNKALAILLTSAGQIPVERLTPHASKAFDAAVDAVRRGECLMVYPEGTLTRDPDLWPMVGRTGAVRIALDTGAPLIPIGQWGVQEILPPYAKRPRLFPRKKVAMIVGDPVALDDLRELPRTAEVLAEATERVMGALTDLVAELRGGTPPSERFDPRIAGVKLTGNPNQVEEK
jgi:1-acyl-sn-glycerol-3-phosphate acyltransferase